MKIFALYGDFVPMASIIPCSVLTLAVRASNKLEKNEKSRPIVRTVGLFLGFFSK